MEKRQFFPYIFTRKMGSFVEGIICIGLKSILKGDLMIPHSDFLHNTEIYNPLDPLVLQRSREAFIHAISSWDPNLTLELHILTFPDITNRAMGQVKISIFVTGAGNSENEVKALLAKHYINLMPLLTVTYPDAEFSPISGTEEFNLRWQPFERGYAAGIQRKKDLISLAEPLSTHSIGFEKIIKREENNRHLIIHPFPWIPSLDSWERLINLFMAQLDPVQMIVRLCPDNKSTEYMDLLIKNINTCDDFLLNNNRNNLKSCEQAQIIRDISIRQMSYLRESQVRLGVFLLAANPLDISLIKVAGRSIIGSMNMDNYLSIFTGGFSYCDVKISDAISTHYFTENSTFTSHEAASAFRLPSPPMTDTIGLPVKLYRTTCAHLPDLSNDSRSQFRLFDNIHNNMLQPVYLENEDRFRHTFILGQTGVGKSTLMESMILQDINNGKGLAVIDPHGDMVESIISNIPENRIKDVILFDLTDREYPIGFNILEYRTIEERDMIIDELYITLDRIYDLKKTGGPIFEANFRGMLKLLMGDKPRKHYIPTLQDFITCYLNKDFRNWLKNDIDDPNTINFVKELERGSGDYRVENVSPYITSKFSRFINDRALNRIVCQKKTAFDFDGIMENGKIFLVNLGKGRFGSVVSSLLANQIVSRFKMAAMKRGEMRHEDRRDFFLYVDECHNLPSENFQELLSEARKYRVGLILSTQYASQLIDPESMGNDLLSAIQGNVGTIILFRLGQEDAQLLSPIFTPYFNRMDIAGLPNFEGYVKLHSIHGVIPPFSFRTEKMKKPADNNSAKKVRERSQRRYGVDVKTLDTEMIKNHNAWRELQKEREEDMHQISEEVSH